MSNEIIQITVGDLKPSLTSLLTDSSGAALNLSTVTDSVKFRMTHAKTGKVAVNDATATITNGATGAVQYDWTAADVSAAGIYRAQWKVLWGTSAQHTTEAFYINIRPVD